MTGGNTNQEDAAQAVLEAAVALGYPGSEVSTMEFIYKSCGYDVGVSALALSVSGGCPGAVAVAVSGASANGEVAIVLGPGTGSVVVPGGPCAGTVLGLSSPRLLARPQADGNGDFSTVVDVPGSACGQFLQVVDVTTCGTTNVSQIP